MRQVLITGYPGRYKWMEDHVGKNAEVIETKVLYRVKVAALAELGGEEEFWLGSDYVKELVAPEEVRS